MKRAGIFILTMFLIVLLMLGLWILDGVAEPLYCNRCGLYTMTSNRLIGNYDMELCDDCYEDFLEGEWGSEYLE